MEESHWCNNIFDLAPSTVTKAQVEGMFLQLITAGIIGVDVIEGVMKWIVCRENKKCRYPPHCWKNDKYWRGVNLQSKEKWRYDLV